MIQNGSIVHEARDSSFLGFQFDSEALNVTILATLTTALSYQLSAICYNIFLGCKPKGRATASDIHKLILVESASPLTIFAAVARIDDLDRLRFRGDLPVNVKIARRDNRISSRVILVIIMLLLVAPVFNLISIFIVLPVDETITFREANFGGVRMGVNSSMQTELESLTDNCSRVPLRVIGPATSLAQFIVCHEINVSLSIPQERTDIRLSAETTPQGQVKVSVISLPTHFTFSSAWHLDVHTDGMLLRTEPILEEEDAARLVHNGQDVLAEYCRSATRERSPHDKSLLFVERHNGAYRASKDFRCKLEKVEMFIDVIFNMTEEINVVEDPVLNAADVGGIQPDATSIPEYKDAGSSLFIIYRRRNVSLLLLLTILFVALAVRVFTGCLFNNDLDEGLEAVVRHRLRVEPDESLLTSSRTVRYNSKAQQGQTAHYGVRRSSLTEVEQFGFGIEIGREAHEED